MITRRSAREALGTNDAGLARFFGVSPSAVSQWGEDDPLPIARQWQARAKRPDIFGPPGQMPPDDISRDAGHGRVGA